MERETWIAACAHRLQVHWRTIDPLELEEVAGTLWQKPELRELPPGEAAARWLVPVSEGTRL
jgi:hypothetical protein